MSSLEDQPAQCNQKKHHTNTNLHLLRVQTSEICSGKLSGRVYSRPSPGAAFFLIDRTELQDQIQKQIQNEISKDIPH